MQNICARKFRSATVTLLLSEDQCPMMMHIFANHSKYFCKQNLYSFVSEKYLLNRCKSIFVLEIWICHSYLVVIWGSVSTEASHVHLCWQRCRLNLYFVTLHSFPSFFTSEVSFLENATSQILKLFASHPYVHGCLLKCKFCVSYDRLDFLPRHRHICNLHFIGSDSNKYVL